jgi:hypothetical protein
MQMGSMHVNAKAKKNGAPRKGRAVFLSNRSCKAFAAPHRIASHETCIGSFRSLEKNPGFSPGKRYVVQRIGAYGQIKPCERQRQARRCCLR